MCGRYSNAQPPQRFAATVQRQVRRDRERDRSDRGGNKSGNEKSSSQPNETSEGSKNVDVLPIRSQLNEGDYYPTHNVAPSSRMPILRLEKPVPLPVDGASSSSTTLHDSNAMVIECMRWGLLPSYTTSIPRGVDALRTINARDDSVLSGQSMWTPLLRKGKRCVVFCQGFFEWLKKPDGTRIAHFCGMLDEGEGRMDVKGKQKALMPMAGLYERCIIDEQEVYSFTVITTESNKQLNFLVSHFCKRMPIFYFYFVLMLIILYWQHDRMPVILPDSQAIMTWLGARPASSKEVCSLLKPYEAGDLDIYPVPREIGKVGNDNDSFILPVSSRKDGIAAAFGRVSKGDKDVNSETHAPLEEEVKAVSPGKKRQLQEDEEMAQALQREEEEIKAKRIKSEPQVNKDKSDEREVITETATKDEHQGEQQTSSKFSPEPFNPPISPPRPHGGYSTSSSSTIQQNSPSRKMATPSKKLEQAAKGTKDIRNFFESK